MAVVPASSRGADLSQGGTITGPLVIDLSGYGAQDVNPLRMILSADWPYTGNAVSLAIGSDTPLRFSGAQSRWDLGGFDLLTNGGAIYAGSLRAQSGAGAGQHVLDGGTPSAGFFAHAAVAQQALDPSTATPEQIATVLEAYGLAS